MPHVVKKSHALLLCGLLLGSSIAQAAPLRLRPDGKVVDPRQFPIGVWLQDPALAGTWQKLGVNFYVGLWHGPTAAQLAALAEAKMPVVADQTKDAAKLPHADQLIGWLGEDEPDNAQPLPEGGYGDCVPAAAVHERTLAMHAVDPSRPIVLNFGEGVADRTWYGRGKRCDGDWGYYKSAMRDAQIVSFDIYPATEARLPVYGQLGYVAKGMRNLSEWSNGAQPLWGVIGTTRIDNLNRRTMPEEIRAQVWMSVVNGARGIVYFVHDLAPSVDPAALLHYPDSVAEITRTNALLQQMAPVLNAAPATEDLATLDTASPEQFETLQRQYLGSLYVIVVNMHAEAAEVKLNLSGVSGPVRDLIAQRDIDVTSGQLHDLLAGWGVAVYSVAMRKSASTP